MALYMLENVKPNISRSAQFFPTTPNLAITASLWYLSLKRFTRKVSSVITVLPSSFHCFTWSASTW